MVKKIDDPWRVKSDSRRHERLDKLFLLIGALETDEPSKARDQRLAELESEAKELIHEELMAHPDEVEQGPSGWSLRENTLRRN